MLVEIKVLLYVKGGVIGENKATEELDFIGKM